MRFKVTSDRFAGARKGGTVELDETDPRTRALLKAGHLSKTRETVGGNASSKPASELRPPPAGPAPGAKKKDGDI